MKQRGSFTRFTRRQDELILDMLKLRDEGKKYSEIAAALGTTKGMVAGSLRRVAEDCANEPA